MNDTKQLLIAARAQIARRNGWCQGAFCNDEGAMCAFGAVNRSALFFESTPAKNALKAALPEPYDSVMFYNDQRGRTQAEVVALFDRAIASLE